MTHIEFESLKNSFNAKFIRFSLAYEHKLNSINLRLSHEGDIIHSLFNEDVRHIHYEETRPRTFEEIEAIRNKKVNSIPIVYTPIRSNNADIIELSRDINAKALPSRFYGDANLYNVHDFVSKRKTRNSTGEYMPLQVKETKEEKTKRIEAEWKPDVIAFSKTVETHTGT